MERCQKAGNPPVVFFAASGAMLRFVVSCTDLRQYVEFASRRNQEVTQGDLTSRDVGCGDSMLSFGNM